MLEEQETHLKEMWEMYARGMRSLIDPSRDARAFQMDVTKFDEERLRQMLRERNLNDRGIRIVLEERLLRSELRRLQPYADVPWYTEYDEAGGTDMPFAEEGLIADIEEKARQKTSRMKRGPKPTKSGETAREEESEEGGENVEPGVVPARSMGVSNIVPTALSLTNTTTTVTVTTSTRPSVPSVQYPLGMVIPQPPSDGRTQQRDGPALSTLTTPWLDAAERRYVRDPVPSAPWPTQTPIPSPHSTVITPHRTQTELRSSRIPQLSDILERSEDRTERSDIRSRHEEEESTRGASIAPFDSVASDRHTDLDRSRDRRRKEEKIRKGASDKRGKKHTKMSNEKRRRKIDSSESDNSEEDGESSEEMDETGSSTDCDTNSSQSERSEESEEDTDSSSSAEETPDDGRRQRKKKGGKERGDKNKDDKKRQKREQRRRVESRRRREIRVSTVLDLLSKWKLKFSGEKKENAENFINRLDDFKSTNQFSSQDVLRALPGVLDAGAGQWFRITRKDIESWPQFKKAFKQKYVTEIRKEDV